VQQLKRWRPELKARFRSAGLQSCFTGGPGRSEDLRYNTTDSAVRASEGKMMKHLVLCLSVVTLVATDRSLAANGNVSDDFQWISSWATGWATMALAQAIEPSSALAAR